MPTECVRRMSRSRPAKASRIARRWMNYGVVWRPGHHKVARRTAIRQIAESAVHSEVGQGFSQLAHAFVGDAGAPHGEIVEPGETPQVLQTRVGDLRLVEAQGAELRHFAEVDQPLVGDVVLVERKRLELGQAGNRP